MLSPDNLGGLSEVPLEVKALLDTRVITVSDMLDLEPGSLIRLDRSAGENIRLHVGGVHLADGDIAAVDNMICLRITEFRERL